MQLSGKTFRITFLIFIPSIIALCMYVYGYNYFGAIAAGNSFDIRSNYNAFISLVCALACYLAVIIYGLYPLTFTTKKYVKSYQNIAGEFEFVKKIVFIGIPVLIILTIIDQLFTYLQLSSYLSSHYLLLYDFSFAILASSMAIVIGALLRLSTQIIKGEFRFYLAKGYCIAASKNEEGDLDRMKYLLSSLDSYNKYLLRKIKFGIKNINKIYSDIMISSNTKKKDEIIKSICQYLGEEDRLKLATYLSTLYKLPETEQFLVKESLTQKLKTIGAFIIAAIPIVISIIQLVSKTG